MKKLRVKSKENPQRMNQIKHRRMQTPRIKSNSFNNEIKMKNESKRQLIINQRGNRGIRQEKQ
jgi:hypothetical protein